MFWVQRLMLELSSSVLQRCCFLSQPQYGSRAPRHALTDRGPETQPTGLPASPASRERTRPCPSGHPVPSSCSPQ